MRRAPLVSVCVPTRGHAAHLGEALASALGQSLEDLEVVVCDDASPDATPEVVAAIRDPRLRFVRHAAPVGVARNRDACLAVARGRHVAWLDSDDALEPGALARQVAVLESDLGISLVHGGFKVVDAAGRPGRDWPAPFARDTVEPGEAAFLHLLASNEITTSTVMVRRAAHDLAGPFGGAAQRRRASSSDWAMWLRLALHGDVAYTAAPIARYRQHPDTISHATRASGERLRCDVSVVRELLRAERALLPDPGAATRVGRAALAAKALLQAGDEGTRGSRTAAVRSQLLAARLVPGALAGPAARLALATARGDDLAAYATSRAMLATLADRLDGTRYGARVRAAASTDAEWEAGLARAAAAVRRTVPPEACVGAVTKWDPTLLALSGRHGRNFPDRRSLPDGYPADSRAAIGHLEQQRRDGLSHLVFPSASFWWLEHYDGLAAHLDAHHRRSWSDEDCVVFDLRAPVRA